MKTLGTLILLGIAVFAGLALLGRQREAGKRQSLIDSGQVVLAMSSAEVLQSRGKPLVRELQPNGTDVWGYADGTLVTFSGDRVISAHRHDVPPPSDTTRANGQTEARTDRSPGRQATWVPGLDRYITHDPGVSALQSIGAGGGSGPRPTPKPSLAEKEWGTSLDQPPKR